MMMNKEFICENLDILIPNPRCELNYEKDYELLIAVMLSAQTTDKRVNEVTKSLFSKYTTLEQLNELSLLNIEKEIKTIGMYKTKARYLKSIVKKLLEVQEFPKTREELELYEGVGRKTANVVLAELFDIPSMPVDTHVERVSKRLGLVKETSSVIEIEKELCEFFDKNNWNRIHKQFVLFGRYFCTSRNPKCVNCLFKNECKYYKKIQN